MNPTPYITIRGGKARAAIAWYAALFGGEVTSLIEADKMPGFEAPDDIKDWVMHAEISFSGGQIMASDDMMRQDAAITGAWIAMNFEDNAKAAATFEALSEGGVVMKPFGPSEWAEGFGMLTDKFGTPWMLNGPYKDFG